MKRVHLLCGLPCSGKTTFARKLTQERHALYLSLDETLITLYGQYSIEEIGHEEHVQRVVRSRKALWLIAEHALRESIEVVLDDGFFLREHREHYSHLCAAVNAQSYVYFLDVPYPVLAARLLHRNAHLPPSNFPISLQQLEQFINLFERPIENEGNDLVIIRSEIFS